MPNDWGNYDILDQKHFMERTGSDADNEHDLRSDYDWNHTQSLSVSCEFRGHESNKRYPSQPCQLLCGDLYHRQCHAEEREL